MEFLDRFRQTTRCVLTLASVAYRGGQSPILGSSNLGSLPTVTWTSPANTSPIASNIAINSVVSATFSKPMNESTLTTSSFELDCVNGGTISTTLTYDVPTRTATLHPTAALASNTTCTATITTDVKDSTGLALLMPYVWSFSTAVAADTTAPTVIAITPIDNAGSVSVNTNVSVSFSESMDPSTVTSSNSAVFTPTLPTPLANNTLATDFVWTFTTSNFTLTNASVLVGTILASAGVTMVNTTVVAP